MISCTDCSDANPAAKQLMDLVEYLTLENDRFGRKIALLIMPCAEASKGIFLGYPELERVLR